MKSVEVMTDFLKPIADLIASMFDDKCEVVIHDFSNIEHSIVYIVNGHITGRKIGDTLTDLGLKHFKENSNQDSFIGYKSITKDGRILRSSSLFIRDSSGECVASLCINYDISELIIANEIFKKMININEIKETSGIEFFTTNVNELLDHILSETITIIGKPVSSMHKVDKIKAIKHLDDNGVFLIKKSIDQVAKFFNISKFTVYNYLDEIRIK